MVGVLRARCQWVNDLIKIAEPATHHLRDDSCESRPQRRRQAGAADTA